MRYLKERRIALLTAAGILVFINIYLGFICASHLLIEDLVYLDVLLLLAGGVIAVRDYLKWRRLGNYLEGKEILSAREEEWLLGSRIAEYVRQERENKEMEIRRRMEELSSLSDYVARWSHEAKLPLTALKLMNERNQDEALKKEMQGCVVRLETLLQTVLMGSKLQCPEHDVKYERFLLADAVREALKNQSYYLIQNQVEISLNLGEEMVYSDRRWLVYLLDQLIANAVKYKQTPAKLSFTARTGPGDGISLTVADNGIGIPDGDLPHIFQRGYVGRKLRKGDYRSTGMGLYFVKETAGLLHISIEVLSEEGQGTSFVLRFGDMADYLMR